MARKKKKGMTFSQEDLNLVPVMNMVMCLIPVILAGSAAVKLGMVNVNAPKFGIGAAAPDESDEKPLNLTVAVGEDGFRITASGADINEVLGLPPPVDPTQPAVGPTVPMVEGKYDFVDLYTKLAKVKERFPEETIVNLAADSKVPFKYLIGVMDVIRLRLEADTYEDLEAFSKANPRKNDQNEPELMWPDVVFAVAQ